MLAILVLILVIKLFKSLVLPVKSSTFSKTKNELLATLSERHIARANCFCFLLMPLVKFLSLVGPKVTPPPFHKGERIEPCLARPVPFCRQGFLPPPLTSLLSLVSAKTRLALACWATTT